MNLFTIDRVYEASYEIKRSEFLSFLVPIERFDEVYDRLKKEHKKANHIVWAKRFLNEFDQIVENSTDDGEPKGTSGVPSLN
ncbi:MAG: YigZ family protein, partial [Epsilonproteobacteria bacterium]|nr:YigZ family protein [Campylobacterota bacterium]